MWQDNIEQFSCILLRMTKRTRPCPCFTNHKKTLELLCVMISIKHDDAQVSYILMRINNHTHPFAFFSHENTWEPLSDIVSMWPRHKQSKTYGKFTRVVVVNNGY